ncbi:hypothetical protein [Methylobacterium sp. CCH5-D2]|uniref:hypothetical protein n=1 Tax=Methylobacterium sp. CCH5-D2 TaxID=1768765 RepID=UPI00082F2C6B|nr:hypothetical protein [Methylobacterium sp. CCH5-D2]
MSEHPMRWTTDYFIRDAKHRVLAVLDEDTNPRDGRAMAAAFLLIHASEAAMRSLGTVDLTKLEEAAGTAVKSALDELRAALTAATNTEGSIG